MDNRGQEGQIGSEAGQQEGYQEQAEWEECSVPETWSIDSGDSNYLLDLADETEYEDILPKTHFNSPYYINVPTPKHSTLSGQAGGSSVGVSPAAGVNASDGLDLYDDGTASFVREYPTDILADRFHKWRKILKGLVVYLREVAYSQEQYARINYSLKNAVKFSFLSDLDENTSKVFDPLTKNMPQKKPQPSPAMKSPREEKPDPFASASNFSASTTTFNTSSLDLGQELQLEPHEGCSGSGFMSFGSGSIQDIQVILKKYHLSMSSQQIKSSKEITQQIIPKLEDLRKDLNHKIKEIKELNADFKTNIQEHVALTGQLLHKYIASVNFLNDSAQRSDLIKLKKNQALKPKHDPYLLKLQLDLQLKRQLLEENYLQEAYINLQTSGMELEKIIFSTVQKTLQRFSSIIDANARVSINNLCKELQKGILSKPPCVEWDNFVTHHPRCLLPWKSTEPIPQPRKLSDIRYPKMKSSMAKCIRAGYLLRKSKYLKSYNKSYFVLTSNYLHEFKSSNFFKLTQDNSEKDDHAIVPSSNNKSRSIVPLMSISLNDSELIEEQDKFTINCKSTYIQQEEQKESFSQDIKKITKSTSTISKFFKQGSSKQSRLHLSLTPDNSSLNMSGGATGKGDNEDNVKSSSITFKRPNDVDVKEFKKWIANLKDLTSFSNTAARSKYIEEKILKAHSKVAASSSLNLAQSSKTTSMHLNSQSTPSLAQRPEYIQITPSSMQLNMRSKVNTPAIDDNGNLIFASERPRAMFNSESMMMSQPQIPCNDASPSSFVSNDSYAASNKQGLTSPQQGGMSYAITSNGMTPVHQQNPSQQGHHSRSVSGGGSSLGPGSMFNTDFKFTPTQNVSSGPVTSASNNSSGSGGGYFAIPVQNNSQNNSHNNSHNNSTAVSQDSTPGTHSPIQGSNLNSNQGLTSNGPYGHTKSPSDVIPRIHINELEAPMPVKVSPVNYPPEPRNNRNGPYNNLKKNSSASSVPSINSLYTASPVLSNPAHNSSSPSLQAGKPQTQPVRRHKKTVSFNSLNSLMFSKKAGNPPHNQYLSDAKINEDDDPDAINIHGSLYS
ncbi:Protein ASK10 [Kluyveromyces marxianus]